MRKWFIVTAVVVVSACDPKSGESGAARPRVCLIGDSNAYLYAARVKEGVSENVDFSSRSYPGIGAPDLIAKLLEAESNGEHWDYLILSAGTNDLFSPTFLHTPFEYWVDVRELLPIAERVADRVLWLSTLPVAPVDEKAEEKMLRIESANDAVRGLIADHEAEYVPLGEYIAQFGAEAFGPDAEHLSREGRKLAAEFVVEEILYQTAGGGKNDA